MSETKKIIERLRRAILKSDLSYVELEKRTGIAKSSIQRYISEKTKKVPVEAVEALSIAVGVSPAYIMGWCNEDINDLKLNNHEKKLVISYREHPDMRKSVDKLLGLDFSESEYDVPRKIAARGGGVETRALSDAEKEAIINQTYAEDL